MNQIVTALAVVVLASITTSAASDPAPNEDTSVLPAAAATDIACAAGSPSQKLNLYLPAGKFTAGAVRCMRSRRRLHVW